MIKFLDLSKFVSKLTPVTALELHTRAGEFHEAGLFSESIFGPEGSREREQTFSYIDLHAKIVHPEGLRILKKLDGKIILKEKNAEVRREIVRKIGVEKLVRDVGAKVKDAQGNYELLMIDIDGERERPYLKMKNPSIGVYHVEGVSPDCKTVKEALNWRNGTDEKVEVLT